MKRTLPVPKPQETFQTYRARCPFCHTYQEPDKASRATCEACGIVWRPRDVTGMMRARHKGARSTTSKTILQGGPDKGTVITPAASSPFLRESVYQGIEDAVKASFVELAELLR